MSHQMQPIKMVDEYFGINPRFREAVIIRQEFTPGKGWQVQSYNKQVSRAWLRKLKAAGVTSVALGCNGRLADFRIEELLKRDRCPLFTGNLIGAAVKL